MLDYLAVGHVARDDTPDGHTVGGAVIFGAVTAARMGLRAAIVTSAARGFDPGPALAGVPLHVVPSDATTTFRNVYRGGTRTQHIRDVAGPIVASDVPDEWSRAPMVFLAPLARELGDDVAAGFPGATVVASLQGWLRRWDASGLVTPMRWDGGGLLPHVDAAIVSEADFAGDDTVARWAGSAAVLIVTRGSDGASLYHRGVRRDVPPFPAREADPTGAGDVFGTAYLVRLHETGDPIESARYASCAAGFSVQAPGVAGIPTRAQVMSRLAQQPRR
jgi:sugar/nucleoside kinase (ribokinase family)